MSALLEHPATLALASTLLHFLWQGAVLGLATFAILRDARLTAGSRYVVGVVALAAMLAAPTITFGIVFPGTVVTRAAPLPTASPSDGAASSVSASITGSSSDSPSTSADGGAKVIAPAQNADEFALVPAAIRTVLLTLWFTGVIVLSLRLLGGWIVARRLAIKAIRPVAPEIQSLATRVAGRLALDRVVRVVESSAVSVPAMIGWMKPVVLLPAAALAGLSPAQVEALIAHELAHVRRHDYLVNLLQTIVETLLFYHPAVWWISRQVRLDREHCCDDLAVGVCDRLTYVTALANLAAMSARPRLALAATDGSLLGRIRRILGQPSDNLSGGGWLAILMVVTLAGGAIASTVIARPSTSSAPGSTTSALTTPDIAAPVEQAAIAATPEESPAAGQNAETSALAQQYELARMLALLDEQRTGNSKALLEAMLKDKAVLEQVMKEVEAASRANQQRTREERDRALERLLQEDAAKFESLLAMKQQLDQERIEVEKRAREAQSRARISALENELQASRAALERAKRQVEAGVVDASVLAKFEAEVRIAENQLVAARSELQNLESEIRVRLREAELALQSERRAAEMERALRGAMTEPQEKYEELARKVLELERLLAARNERRYVAELVGAEPVANPNEPVRAGDQLVIEIAGEPDLPREYEVRSDGTIRLPLIGPVRVVGLTASQVREAVAKQIIDRGLGKSPGVAVSLRRPRGK